jgi:YD repeat-containing protein
MLRRTSNYENRLSKVVDASGNATTYVYGYDGNLLKTATSAGATTFVYGQGIVPLVVKSSGVTQKYLLASGKIVSEWDGTSTTNHRNFLYTDALGSVAGLTNQGATIVRNTTYDPYGRLLADSGTVTLANEYVGAYGVRDMYPGSTTDRYIMGVREYNGYTGRFLSE